MPCLRSSNSLHQIMILVSLNLSFSFFAARPSNNVQWDGRHVKRWHGWRVRSFHFVAIVDACCLRSELPPSEIQSSRAVCLEARGAASLWLLEALSSNLLSLLLFRSNAHISCHRCCFFSNRSSLRYRMGGGMKGGGMGGGYVSFVACVLLEVFLLRVPSCFASDCSTGVEF